MGSNLPPGVTPADIDKHFGTPELHVVRATAQFWVKCADTVDVNELVTDAFRRFKTAEICHMTDVDTDAPKQTLDIEVGVSIETQFTDTTDISEQINKQIDADIDDERVDFAQHVDTEVEY